MGILLVAVFVACIGLHIYYWPWKLPVLNLVELVIMGCLLMNIVTAARDSVYNLSLLVIFFVMTYLSILVIIAMACLFYLFKKFGIQGKDDVVFSLGKPPSNVNYRAWSTSSASCQSMIRGASRWASIFCAKLVLIISGGHITLRFLHLRLQKGCQRVLNLRLQKGCQSECRKKLCEARFEMLWCLSLVSRCLMRAAAPHGNCRDRIVKGLHVLAGSFRQP